MNKLFPALKLIGLICLTTAMLWLKSWFLISIFLALTITTIFFLKTNKHLGQRIYALIFISICIVLFQLLFNFQVDLTMRLILGIVNAEKIMALSLLVLIYSATTSFSELSALFAFLPSNISLMLTLAFSLLVVMTDEIKKIALVQSARGLNTKSLNPKKSIVPLIIPLLHRSFMRAEKIAVVLQAKGYDYQKEILNFEF